MPSSGGCHLYMHRQHRGVASKQLDSAALYCGSAHLGEMRTLRLQRARYYEFLVLHVRTLQVGLKLLGYEIRIASRHALKAAQGKTLSRRERTQLTRTTADLFRLVPMIIIVVSVTHTRTYRHGRTHSHTCVAPWQSVRYPALARE